MSPGNIHINWYCRVCNTQKWANNFKSVCDFHSAVTERQKPVVEYQRAKVVIRLAHISKKSMVWLPRRGGAEDKVLPVKEPVREPESEWFSAVVESKLDLGLCRPAAEQERWGVEEPDLCSTISSERPENRNYSKCTCPSLPRKPLHWEQEVGRPEHREPGKHWDVHVSGAEEALSPPPTVITCH